MIITRTPLRISFLGGGTDFPDFYKKHGGCVVTTAIKEIVNKAGELKHELVREAMKKVGIKEGIEISFQSDVPSAGSGLGSSSTVTVGTLNALYQYTGRAVDAERLAKEACEIEIKILGKPIGVQDQYIAAYGGVRFMEFKKSGKIVAEDLGLSEENIKNKNEVLRKMADQAREAKKMLVAGKIYALGRLMDEGWRLKRQLASRISDLEIDRIYAAAKKAGAIGGKISGAGGGGFLTLFVPTEKREGVRKSLAGLREMPIGLSRDGSKVIFNIR